MKCMILEDLEGNRRAVIMGKSFRFKPGEKIIDREDCIAAGQFLIHRKELKRPEKRISLQQELETELGAGFGDVMKRFAGPIAKLLGKSQCSSCDVRKIIVNGYGKLKAKYGMIEALRIMKLLWQDSFDTRIPGEEILKQLQEKLA